ncbi:MAG: (2E,6E)-farnesyl diphosphate synthase [Spongiibacteraceae bacterium]|jgi:geranylgeranyl pyrophosphate synthase|nr:(2E,6E)-farnesyl diphosphate synthase [Spongiibacteraceae bacterium]
MSDASFEDYLKHARQRADRVLAELLDGAESEFGLGLAEPHLERLTEAMRYSLLVGGKRIRPVLVYAAGQAVNPGVTADQLDHVAAAVEYIHAYSLIHDDLPAMDNDDLRRGQPTCHRAFDEPTAILAGDALQSRAFELLCDLPGASPEVRLALVRTLAAAAGPRGMVGGQAIDLGSARQQIDIDQLEQMHRLKTGALIRAAVRMGALAAGGDADELAALDRYATAIGLAFQVQDDILDVTGETATLGKQSGADAARAKPTYPALLGLAEAQAEAGRLYEEAVAALVQFSGSAEPLRRLAAFIIDRTH